MNFSRITTVIVLVACAGILSAWILFSNTTNESHNVDAFSMVSDASYTGLDGNSVSLSQYAGKPLVVNSWASWCPFCVQELQDFSLLADTFSDKGLVVLAINRKESAEKASGFLDTQGDLNSIVFVLDPDDSFYQSIGGFSMPETVFYDEKGAVVFHKRGFMSLEEMKLHTNKLFQ